MYFTFGSPPLLSTHDTTLRRHKRKLHPRGYNCAILEINYVTSYSKRIIP